MTTNEFETEIKQFNPLPEELKNFIFSSWINSYWKCSKHTVMRHVYEVEHRRIISKILEDEKTDVFFISVDGTENVVSYIIAGNDVIHFIFTKANFRQLGFANQLIEKVGQKTYYSQETLHIKKLSAFRKLIFNWYRLWI